MLSRMDRVWDRGCGHHLEVGVRSGFLAESNSRPA